MLCMPDTNLPIATSAVRTIKLGRIETKSSKPSETIQQMQTALNNLEKAVKEKVFIDNGESK